MQNYAKLCDLEDMKIIPHSNKIILILGHETEPCTIAESLSYAPLFYKTKIFTGMPHMPPAFCSSEGPSAGGPSAESPLHMC